MDLDLQIKRTMFVLGGNTQLTSRALIVRRGDDILMKKGRGPHLRIHFSTGKTKDTALLRVHIPQKGKPTRPKLVNLVIREPLSDNPENILHFNRTMASLSILVHSWLKQPKRKTKDVWYTSGALHRVDGPANCIW